MSGPTLQPRIRLVVVNYNGGEMTLRCLRNLGSCGWPAERLELVLVDNASRDGIAQRVRSEMPSVEVVETGQNLGFAGGANEGLRDLDGVDFVGIVNNHAFPEHGWLDPLVEALTSAADVAAAAPKILLANRYVSVTLRSRTARPGPHDARDLGVMVMGVIVGGEDRYASAVFHEGFLGPEHGKHGRFQWTSGDAELWVPFGGDEPIPETIELRIASSWDVDLTIDGGAGSTVLPITGEPAVFEVRLNGEPFDIINNVGVRLVEGGWAGDRGYLEIDEGQYDSTDEVFGWCGAAVLMKPEYIADVGPFDPTLFLYYEDTDLSWRGRLRGWRYVYVPTSRVRHLHAATTQEGSALFHHYVDRNRLLVFLRNAPAPAIADALWRYVKETATIATRDVAKPLIRRGPIMPEASRRKVRSLGGFLRKAAPVLASRVREGRRLNVDRVTVAKWAVPH